MENIEEPIIEQAKAQLGNELELNPEIRKAENLVGYVLCLTINNQQLVFDALVKNEIRNIHLDKVIEYKNLYKHFILIAKRLYPNIKKQLREEGVNYLEANGNLFIKMPNVHLFVDAHAPIQERREAGNRAFTKTGLQVLYQLLLDPSFINAPQREIAKRAGVALGNIPRVIEGLLKSNYLLRFDEKTFQFNKIEELLHKWARDFENTLRPTLEIAKFKIIGNITWQEIGLETENTYWGGEPGADVLTNYLRPEVLTLYTHLNKKELMQRYRLMPDTRGDIEVFKAFWPQDDAPLFNKVVHPLLVYVDLINTNEKRNTETAKMIFDEYIKPNF